MNSPENAWNPVGTGLEALPESIVDSHGMLMDVSGAMWRFNDVTHPAAFDFANYDITNPWLLYSLKRYSIFCARRISPIESYNIIRLNTLYLSRTGVWAKLSKATDLNEHETLLNRAMSEARENLEQEKILYAFHRLRAWFVWCSDYIPELGFLPEEAYKWQLVKVPRNESGVAVRTSDPTGGPIDDAELILLRRALLSDISMAPGHVQQRAAIWFALVFGRNPSNFVLLKQGDFQKLDEEVDGMWFLNIPRIKKRALPRTTFKAEYVDESLAEVIQSLITHGPSAPTLVPSEAPLFARSTPRDTMVDTPLEEWAWHLNAGDFTRLIQDAVDRYGLISPRTGEPLYLTTRRLRYTFATNRVREGISARDLADALDHSDLQHVQVYFDARSTVVERLDRAAALHIAPKLQLFKGRPVQNAEHATFGKDPAKRIRIIPELISPDHQVRDLGVCGKAEFCNLFPPYSCYPCDKFEPYHDSLGVHEVVFDFLVERRERLRSDPLESSRIAVQLDEVIYACAELIIDIRKSQNGQTN